jgi:hypothetical protein
VYIRNIETGDRQMTKHEAQAALESHTKVEAGNGDDHDTGHILAINGDMADVGWDSGVRTPCPITDLQIVT